MSTTMTSLVKIKSWQTSRTLPAERHEQTVLSPRACAADCTQSTLPRRVRFEGPRGKRQRTGSYRLRGPSRGQGPNTKCTTQNGPPEPSVKSVVPIFQDTKVSDQLCYSFLILETVLFRKPVKIFVYGKCRRTHYGKRSVTNQRPTGSVPHRVANVRDSERQQDSYDKGIRYRVCRQG